MLLLFSQTALLLLLIDGARPMGTHKLAPVVLIVGRRVEARNKALLEANVRQGCTFAGLQQLWHACNSREDSVCHPNPFTGSIMEDLFLKDPYKLRRGRNRAAFNLRVRMLSTTCLGAEVRILAYDAAASHVNMQCLRCGSRKRSRAQYWRTGH